MKMQFNTLPDKLIECALWCVWKYEDRDGKPTKVPYNPRTGGRAQSNNPATFSDFKTAVAAFGTCKYDGMGIGVFPPFVAPQRILCKRFSTKSRISRFQCAG